MGSANERRRYNATSSLIGWANTQNGPCKDSRDRNDMESLSALLALCEREHRWPMVFLHQGPVMPSFDVIFVISLEKLLNKQSSFQWFDAMTRYFYDALIWVLFRTKNESYA